MRTKSKLLLTGLSLGLVAAVSCWYTQAHADSGSVDPTKKVDILMGNGQTGAAISNDADEDVSSVVVDQQDLADVINEVGDPADVVNGLDTNQSMASARRDAKQAFARYAQKTKNYIDSQHNLSDSVKTNLKGQVDAIVKVTNHKIDQAKTSTDITDAMYNGLLGAEATSASDHKVKINKTLDSVKTATGSDQTLTQTKDLENRVNQLLDQVNQLNQNKQGQQNNNSQSNSSDKVKTKNQDVKSATSATGDNDSNTSSDGQAGNSSASISSSTSQSGNAGSSSASSAVPATGGSANQSSNSQQGQNQNVDSFGSVQEMEQYASQHGANSVEGKTVTTTVNDVESTNQDDQYQTSFMGDNNTRFVSSEQDHVTSGEKVTVKIVHYQQSGYNPMVVYSGLQATDGTSAGQSGNAPTGSVIPQTGVDVHHSQLLVLSGLAGLALASSGAGVVLATKRHE